MFQADTDDFVPLTTVSVRFPRIDKQLHAVAVVSWGFHAALVADSDDAGMRQRYGNERFKIAAAKNMKEVHQNYKGTINVGETNQLHDCSYLLFTPLTHLESGFMISPSSQPPSSGRVFMVYIPTYRSIAQQAELMPIMMEAYDRGKHVNHRGVVYLEITNPISVAVDEQPSSMRRWCVDGKIIECEPGNVLISPASSVCNTWNLQTLTG